MSLKRSAPSYSDDASTKIYTSQPIHDRESIFIAYYSPHPGLPHKELQALDEAKSASHRILAWRTPSKQLTLAPTTKILCDTGHDDDGEQWAGKRLENVMVEQDVQGSICVGRWYGGVLLGPVRFKHIEDSAKEAVKVWRDEQDGVGKRQRTNEPVPSNGQQNSQPETMRPEELQRRKEELIRTLKRRDESIVSLRTLLERKKAELLSLSISKTLQLQPSQTSSSQSSPSRRLNYDIMPFARIQVLENARDASIQFLLKQLDKVEEEHAEAIEEKKKLDAVEDAQDEAEVNEAWSDFAATTLEIAAPIKPIKDADG